MDARHLKVKLLWSAAQAAGGSAWSALWTFPSILASAFLVAWGAEAAQFLISQGLALAILAWLQTLPEFAVEAVIAWNAGRDPVMCFVASPPPGCHSHLAIANYTGAIRLLVGLGWPMIFFVAAYSRRRDRNPFAAIQLSDENSVQILGTVPPLLYFFWIWHKGSIGLVDAGVLVVCYIAFLAVLWRFPPQGEEGLDDVPRVARWAYTRPGHGRTLAIGGLFAAGGAMLYFTAHPFLESMIAVAATFGISQFVFVQWVAPLLSEFPEYMSASLWARRPSKVPMAMMNMLSSNVNQWTVLAAMIPIVFSLARGQSASLPFDGVQRLEILLTILQSSVAVLLLINMRFEWWNALLLLVLWFAQFFEAEWRDEMCWIYGAWIVGMIISWIWARPKAPAILYGILRNKKATGLAG